MSTVLITGATSGIGYELAKIFASKKYNLLLVARNTKDLKEVQKELQNKSVKVSVFSADLSHDDSAEKIYKFSKNKKIEVSILVNNAGIGETGNFADGDPDKISAIVHVNMASLTKLTRLFLPDMIKAKNGKILNVSSMAAFQPGPYMATYHASKAYVLSLSIALSAELKDKGITVTALCPGPTSTPFHKKAGSLGSLLLKLKKPAEAKDVAEFGYNSLMKGKVVAVHGVINRFLVCISRYASFQTLAVYTAKLHRK